MERSKFTLACSSFARAWVNGPSSGMVYEDGGGTLGWATSAPPFRKSHPRLFTILGIIISLEWGKVHDVEGVAYAVLGGRYVDDVGVVVDILEYLERSISSRLELGVPLLWKAFFTEVYPHKIAFVEDHGLLSLVVALGLMKNLFLDGGTSLVMEFSHVLSALDDVHVGTLVKW